MADEFTIFTGTANGRLAASVAREVGVQLGARPVHRYQLAFGDVAQSRSHALARNVAATDQSPSNFFHFDLLVGQDGILSHALI